MEEYKVVVYYTWSYKTEEIETFDKYRLFAKSEEQARGRAKRYAEQSIGFKHHVKTELEKLL